MENTMKEDFVGGYIEYFIPQLPKYEYGEWKVKVYAKLVFSNVATKKVGKKALLNKGFTTNGAKSDEFYKNFKILEKL